jgi:hypothetical protein
MNEKKYVAVNNHFIVTVSDIWVTPSGCGQCKIEYDAINLTGVIYTEEDNYEIAHDYSADINSWYLMCTCDPFADYDENTTPGLLFKGHIKRDYAYLYHYLIDKNSLQIIDDIESWKVSSIIYKRSLLK